MSRIKPKIVAVEPDAESFMHMGGRTYAGVNVTVDQETKDAMFAGFVCAKCFEPQESAWPEVCSMPGCGMAIRDKQGAMLEELYQGERWIGSRQSIADELEQMPYHKKSRILLPPGRQH